MESPILGLLLTVLLVLANAFFVAAEFAIVKVRASQIELLAQSGSRAARLGRYLVTHLDACLSTIQLGVTLTSLGLGWIGEPVVAKLILNGMHLVGIDLEPGLAHGLALPVAFVGITFLHIVFGELVPKALALQHAQSTTLAVAFPLWLFSVVFWPAIVSLNWVANRVLRLVGLESASESAHSHSGAELRFLLEQGREGGTIEEDEHELIENVFEFGETSVREIMVPRTNVSAIDVTASPGDLVALLVEGGFSRIPVYEGSLDKILGVIHAKDLLTLMEHRDLIIVRDLLRTASFVPETMPIDELLREFQRRKVHIAIVVDEFGGTAGLVTMEDVLEELVGEIEDEHDSEHHDVEKVAERTYVVNAALSIPDVNDHVEEFTLPEGSDYTSLGGFITKRLGRIPEVNETFDYDSVRMTILKTADHHVDQVRLEKLETATAPAGEADLAAAKPEADEFKESA